MRLAFYQTISPAGNIPAGFAVIEAALSDARAAGVDMLTLPELFLPGYNAVQPEPPSGWDEVLPRLCQMCQSFGIAMTIGLPEYTEDAVYNSAYAIGADGDILATFRKLQLFGPREQRLFQPGERHVIFDYRGTRFALLICYDVEFPEHTRSLARAGVQVVLAPTANMMPFINVNQILIPARAAENAITIVYANYTGSEGDLDYSAHSVICGPDGYSLGQIGADTGLVTAVLNTDAPANGIPFATQLADLRSAPDP